MKIDSKKLSRQKDDFKLDDKEVQQYQLNNLSILYARKFQNNLAGKKKNKKKNDEERPRDQVLKINEVTIDEQDEERLKQIKKNARNNFIKTFHKIKLEEKLFKNNLILEQTPLEKSLSNKKSTYMNKKIAKEIMRLEGECFLDKNFEDNLRLELLKEMNSTDNLDWMLRKNDTLKKMHLIKNTGKY